MKFSKVGILSVIAMVFFLSACANRYPEPINQRVNTDVTVKDIQNGLKVDNSFVIRWGGVIANINNHHKETWLEVVQLPLAGNGEPQKTDTTDGRFLVKVDTFLDPAIYAKGRVFTVVGALSGVTKGKIGEYDYQYPVVNAEGYMLWPERKEVIYQTLYYPISYWDPYFSYYYPVNHYRRGYYPSNSSSHRHNGYTGSTSSSQRSDSGQQPRSAPPRRNDNPPLQRQKE